MALSLSYAKFSSNVKDNYFISKLNQFSVFMKLSS